MVEEGILFKKIDNPFELRRNLLEASKQMIHGLQKYERLRAIRVRKAEEIIKLKSIVKEINALNAKLKKEFPDIIFKTTKLKEAKEERVKAKEKVEKKKEAMPERKESRELVDLEKQLKDIERKLETIS